MGAMLFASYATASTGRCDNGSAGRDYLGSGAQHRGLAGELTAAA